MAQPALWGRLLHLLYPPRCQLCGRLHDDALCPACRAQAEWITWPYCERCGRALDPRAHAAPQCAQCRRPGPLDGARACGHHVGVLREAVVRLKYSGRTRLAEPLGLMLAGRIAAEADSPAPLPLPSVAALIPVPLHPARRAERGFDQAELLAEVCGGEAQIPVWGDLLQRDRDTPQQTRLSDRERLKNVRGAFSAPTVPRLAGEALLLVDDVYTTGATLRECARALKRAGAAAVYALTVTRSVPDWHPSRDLPPPPDQP